MAAGPKTNFECACVIEKIIAVVGNDNSEGEKYKWLLQVLFKSLSPNFICSGKVSQLREWMNFSNQQRSNDDLEVLKLFLDAVTAIESKKNGE